MAPKISDLQAQMESTKVEMKDDIATMIEDAAPDTEVGKTLKMVTDVIKSENAYEVRQNLEPTPPAQTTNTGLAAYLSQIKKEGEDKPISGLKFHLHSEDGAHELLSSREHEKYHKSSSNFYLNTQKKTFTEHFWIAQRMNMELAYFDTLNEQKDYGEKAAFENNPEINSVFISGVRDKNNIWRWAKKKEGRFEFPQISYAQWSNRQPDNWRGKENVIQLRKNGEWNDIAHTAKLPALYKIKTVESFSQIEGFSSIEEFSQIEDFSQIEGFLSNQGSSLIEGLSPAQTRDDNNIERWGHSLRVHTGVPGNCGGITDTADDESLAQCYCPETWNVLNNYKTYFSKLHTNYNNLVETIRNSLSVLNTKRQQLDRIKRKTNIYSQNSLIDNKKNLYSEENLKKYSKIYYYVALIIYYIGLIVSLILSKFFPNELYKNITILLLVILYIILPFILGKIINFLYMEFIKFLEKKNLRDDIISYTDIVNDYESNNSQYHPEL